MKQKGFTLIELVVVIVILGILAAVALPKFVNLQGDAGTAAAQGVAGAISSATSMNYAKRLISSSAAGTFAMNSTTVCAVSGAGTVGAAVNASPSMVSGVTLATSGSGNNTFGIAAGSGSTDCSTTAMFGQTVQCSITSSQTGATAATAFVTCSN